MQYPFSNRTALASAGAKRIARIAVAAALVLSTAAMRETRAAATPHLSGNYAMQFTSVCQGSLSIQQDPTSHQVSVQYSSQDTSQHVVTATFTPSSSNSTSGNMSFTGNKVSGTPLIVIGTGGGSGGDAFASKPDSGSGTYTLASGTFSFTQGGSSISYSAVHGAVSSNGVIQSFTFGGLEGNSCMTSGIGLRQ